MAVDILWIPVAVTNRGERLHTEKERLEVRAGRHSRNAFATEGVELGEDEVDDDINTGNESGELRPA